MGRREEAGQSPALSRSGRSGSTLVGVGESDQLPLSMSMAFEERYGHGWLLCSPASVSEQGIFLPSSVLALAVWHAAKCFSSVESRGICG